MHGDPKMFTGHAVRGGKAKGKGKGATPKDEGDLKGDLLIRDLWTQGAGIIHDMRVVKTDVIYYQSKNPRSAWKLLRGRRRRISYTLVSTRVGTSLPSLPQWKDFSQCGGVT